MKKHFLLTIVALLACVASFASISGPTSACTGVTVYYHDSVSTGGTWSSSNTAVATINSSTGVGVTVGVGTTTISYTTLLTTDTYVLTVSAAPAPITGTLSVCAGATTTLADATIGGTWSSSASYIATVNSGGTVYGVAGGSATIYYTVAGGCSVSATVTVGAPFVDSIYGGGSICIGSSTTLTDVTIGGVWTVANPTVATISPTGIVTGLTAGGTLVSYTVSGSCGSSTAVAYVSVSGTTGTGSISGPSSVYVGNTINLTDGVSGGVWSSSASSVATVSATGVVTGVTAGTATISYGVTGCGGLAYATHSVTVSAFGGISGNVNFGSTAHYGPVKIWVITLSGTILAAIDSTVVYSAGTSVPYSFASEPTNSYRIKAATMDSVFVGTGFIPTYHTSSFYWSTANVLAHTAGVADINQDINMAYGTVTSGPGFVAGDVTSGANKGTASAVPVSNMIMYIFNASSLQLMQAVRTDAAGHYSFSNLPVGATYYVFPDSLNYQTTPYSSISLTAAAPSVTTASFYQHTVAPLTIKPIYAVGVNEVAATASILAFPNPTNGKVHITWNMPSAEDATVIVADITGREVFRSNINMTAGAGVNQIDLSSLTNGLYTISVKSAAVNYNNKIQVQH